MQQALCHLHVRCNIHSSGANLERQWGNPPSPEILDLRLGSDILFTQSDNIPIIPPINEHFS